MSTRWRILGVVLALAATLGLRWLSTLPMAAQTAPDAVLRLAWSARPERVETCREQTAEQLANLPAHMRQPLVCEGTTASYRLEELYNGERLAHEIVRGGGLRRDRRLYVFREVVVPAGEAEVSVRMDRIEPGAEGSPTSGAAAQELPGRSPLPARPGAQIQARADAVPAHLSLAERLHFAPRRVVLVTYDEERRQLTLR